MLDQPYNLPSPSLRFLRELDLKRGNPNTPQSPGSVAEVAGKGRKVAGLILRSAKAGLALTGGRSGRSGRFIRKKRSGNLSRHAQSSSQIS